MKKPFVANLDAIRHTMKHYPSELPVQYWLNTGQEELHRVLGSTELGIPYGKLIELCGNESNGKTALALEIGRYAQADDAYVIWVDFENSFDSSWARKRGMRLLRQFTLIQAYLKKAKGNKEEDIATCEELCAEMRAVIKAVAKHYKKILVVVDSIAAMETAKESEAGDEHANMNTGLDLPRYLSRTMKKWTKLGLVHNVMFLVINQLRVKPMSFGDPEYTVGGKAIPFYCSIRAKLRLVKGGRMIQGAKTIGLKGSLTNFKNKVGHGSTPYEKIGFKIFYEKGKPAQFLELKEVKGEDNE